MYRRKGMTPSHEFLCLSLSTWRGPPLLSVTSMHTRIPTVVNIGLPSEYSSIWECEMNVCAVTDV